jgi:hypothetical protein
MSDDRRSKASTADGRIRSAGTFAALGGAAIISPDEVSAFVGHVTSATDPSR